MKVNYKYYLNTKHRRIIRKIIVDITYPILNYSLSTLARLCGTDKSGFHNYTDYYNTHLKHLRNKKIKLLEIGVGGYDNPDYGGNSLRMWKKYFNNGQVYGIDIYDKSNLEESRIKTFQGNQTDIEFLKKVINKIGKPDVIIDDGSHINSDIICSFKYLFSYLKSGGVYVIEDTQTSYLNEYGGDRENINSTTTTMNYFKKLVDHVNDGELGEPLIKEIEPIFMIKEIHFYKKIIFIIKGP